VGVVSEKNKYVKEIHFLHNITSVLVWITHLRRWHAVLNPSCLSSSSHLAVRPSRCVTVWDRSFATAGPRLWNRLPEDITTAHSLTVFRRWLKTQSFRQSYPDIILSFAFSFSRHGGLCSDKQRYRSCSCREWRYIRVLPLPFLRHFKHLYVM